MNEIIIKRQNFESAKKRLKEFSEKKETELKIKQVETDSGLFGLLNHKVTGSEFNDRMNTIRKHLVELNKSHNQTNKEFRAVYDALEALDEDYIARIISTLKALEKANQDIRKHQTILNEGANKLNAQQLKTDRLVEQMKMNIHALKKFKQKLDSLSHLTDIDQIWNDCQMWHQELKVLTNAIDTAQRSGQENAEAMKDVEKTVTTMEQNIENLFTHSTTITNEVETIMAFTTKLAQLTHLNDVDRMWDSLTSVDDELRHMNVALNEVEAIVTQHGRNIVTLLDFMNEATRLTHLMEVDEIWEKTEQHQTRLRQIEQQQKNDAHSLEKLTQTDAETLQVVSTHSHTLDEHTAQLIERTKREEALAEQLEHYQQNTKEQFETVTKKMKYAYWIAGSSLGLALVELVFLLAR